MPTTYYYTVNGEIIGEHREGEADSRDYMLDRQGSVVLVLQNDWGMAEASYHPHGEFMGNWNISQYKFSWKAAHGYRQTGLEWSSHYIRARHYSFMDGGWTTRDPLWPKEMPYQYVNGRPTKDVDYFGTAPTVLGNGCNASDLKSIEDYCQKINNLSSQDRQKIMDCMKKKGYNNYEIRVHLSLRAMSNNCNNSNICIVCVNSKGEGMPNNWPKECPPSICNTPFPPTGFTWSEMLINDYPLPTNPLLDDGCDRPVKFPKPYEDCRNAIRKTYPQCASVIEICTAPSDTQRVGVGFVFAHEIIHAVGRVAHPNKGNDFIDDLDKCTEFLIKE